MLTTAKLTFFGVVAIFAALAANWAEDLAFQVNALVILIAAAVGFFLTMREEPKPAVAGGAALADARTGYMDDVVRAGVVATALWGVVGFLVGVVIAFQLAFPI
ncbi:MAG: cytochrome-c oxidase, cbb3-type subunit I, partial [Pseudomonadota bacterium]